MRRATTTVSGIGLDTGFNGPGVGFRDAGHLLAQVRNADRDGLDVVTMTDHPYLPAQFDAHATLGFVLGATTRVTGVSTVTNLPCRPAPMLAKTAAGLSDLSGGRFALGVGAGVFWDEIVKRSARSTGSPRERIRQIESKTMSKLRHPSRSQVLRDYLAGAAT